MPRANRYFVSGYVWHITHPSGDEFQSFQTFNRFAPFKPFKSFNRCASFKALRRFKVQGSDSAGKSRQGVMNESFKQ